MNTLLRAVVVAAFGLALAPQPGLSGDSAATKTAAAPVDVEAAEKLYKRQCRACHGPTAKGLASYPKLAAQPADYIEGRLRQYRAGETLGPNTPLMAPRARKLSDQDIANLAAFISSLPG
ncbi:MAG: c-type cytochrome [Marinibacterium sp.]|nr:c-type cytochrome [Marinibacterium sp.]